MEQGRAAGDPGVGRAGAGARGDEGDVIADVPGGISRELEPALARARELVAGGQVVAAVAAYRELVSLYPKLVPLRMEFARTLEQHNQGENAVLELDRALEAQPDDVRLLCARASLLTTLLRYERADADLRRAQRLQENNVEVLTAIGSLACKRGRWREGLDPLRRATELAPDHAPAFYYLGEVYQRLDQLIPSLTAYERAVALDPHNARAIKAMANMLDRLKRPDEAAAAHRRALEAQKR